MPAPKRRRRAATACKRTVSGSISLPARGSFHLSLTVLVRYRSPGVLSLRRWSAQIPPWLHEPQGTRVRDPGSPAPFAYGAITLSGSPFQQDSARRRIANSPGQAPVAPHNPGVQAPRFRLFPFRSPLLRESISLSSPLGTEMFQFPRFPPLAKLAVTGVPTGRVPPFGHPGINARYRLPQAFRR